MSFYPANRIRRDEEIQQDTNMAQYLPRRFKSDISVFGAKLFNKFHLYIIVDNKLLARCSKTHIILMEKSFQ